jgi:hypothetical protein
VFAAGAYGFQFVTEFICAFILLEAAAKSFADRVQIR